MRRLVTGKSLPPQPVGLADVQVAGMESTEATLEADARFHEVQYAVCELIKQRSEPTDMDRVLKVFPELSR